MKKHIKLLPLLISAVIVASGITAYLTGISFLDIMELKTIDLRFQSRKTISPTPEIVIAVVDEKSIAREGKWIWPRSKFTDLVTRLSDAGVRVIAFDIGFLEADERRVLNAIDLIHHTSETYGIRHDRFDQYLGQLKGLFDYDQQLADAISKSSAKVVLGYFFQMDSRSAPSITEEEFEQHQGNVRGGVCQYVRVLSGDPRNIPLREACYPQSNITKISNATDYAGYFNMFSDTDGVIRWMTSVIRCNDRLYAPLAVMAASAYLGNPVSLKISEYGVEKLQIGRLSIPTDEYGRILINYRGPEKTFPHISVTDILHGEVSDTFLKDKIVLVGATAVGIYDMRVTPMGEVFPGVEIHANIVDSILSRDFIQKPGWSVLFDIAAILLSGLFFGIVLSRAGIKTGSITGFVLFFGYIMICQYLFSQKGWILNLVYPLCVMILVYVCSTVYKYLVESKQKKFIRGAFSTYLAPSVVKQIIDSPDKLVLGGEQRTITAFFSDVQGFTSISEKLSPNELVDLLNEFLTEMTDIILKYEGTVDKFEGDAIIAFFGAPNELENQAEVACMACIDMQRRLAGMRIKWKEQGKPELNMRIGMNTGPAVVGNMGSKNRMDYTMMGDTVNTAARLEGVNKVYGIYTLVSETTFKAAASSRIVAREVDAIRVVGKKEPVRIYELMGYTTDIDQAVREMLDCYASGLADYRKQNFSRAASHFDAALALVPDDSPSMTMLNRCREYQAHAPGEDWDGAFTMKTK
ncbi:MAG: adenylate/guanylate cyclase domain-containing protein [Desulfobacterales bacterium]|nr:adenylate/guanylate cyclase domain-containing protein [Desulfobacterales bacterium]MDD4072764.1 adenylate/guanylate cyclase domain-containing protein [Desulfobacterales bacterium]MDD4391372.1 adenylate/guanylate cyclase domain-containing protein [Desulfobacterales bacterium]